MQKRYFGTDGIRGQVGKSPIHVDFMLKLGWAVGCVLVDQAPSRVLIGRDTRLSGNVLQSALQAGLSAAGVDTHLLGVLPTPAVAYLTHSLRASAGIVISASHNPFQDNGVKFFNHQGMKLSDELECAIEAELEKPLQMASSTQLGHVTTLVDAKGRYIEFCKSTFPQQLSLKGLKVVLDCANGAAYEVAPAVFHELGAQVTCMHCQPNGMNINQQCGATDLKSLQNKVVESGADVGVAFDGDADRVILVDHQGEVVDGDEILCILAKDSSLGMASRLGVVGTLMSNLGLEQALSQSGIEFVRTAVGDRYVLEELQTRGWTLGGESSGHIVNLDYTTTGDGIVSALQVLRVMQMTAQSLFELKRQMKKQPQCMVNVPVFGNVQLESYPGLQATIVEAQNQLGARGRILIRPSGTQSCVRVMAEGEDEKEIRALVESLAQKVSEAVG